MITRDEWDAMDDQQRWDLFNAMQAEITALDESADAGDDDEDMTWDSKPVSYSFGEVLQMREDGARLVDIAQKFGRSYGWAGWAVSRAKHLRRLQAKLPSNHVSCLTVDRRILSALYRHGVRTVDQAWDTANSNDKVRGLGADSMRKLKSAILAYRILPHDPQ